MVGMSGRNQAKTARLTCGLFQPHSTTMPKAIDLRIKGADGMKFEDVVKRILAAPPLPKKSKRKKPAQNPRLN
jgi:hypothetical protein